MEIASINKKVGASTKQIPTQTLYKHTSSHKYIAAKQIEYLWCFQVFSDMFLHKMSVVNIRIRSLYHFICLLIRYFGYISIMNMFLMTLFIDLQKLNMLTASV